MVLNGAAPEGPPWRRAAKLRFFEDLERGLDQSSTGFDLVRPVREDLCLGHAGQQQAVTDKQASETTFSCVANKTHD
jgi:hypothetical protein